MLHITVKSQLTYQTVRGVLVSLGTDLSVTELIKNWSWTEETAKNIHRWHKGRIHEFTFELAWFDVGVTSDICVIFPKSAMLTKNIYTMAWTTN